MINLPKQRHHFNNDFVAELKDVLSKKKKDV